MTGDSERRAAVDRLVTNPDSCEVSPQSRPHRSRAYRLPLPPHAIACRQARRILDWALRDWSLDGSLVDDARVVLSELVSNAVLDSSDVFEIELRLDDEIVIEVWDRSSAFVQKTMSDDLSLNGRGLHIVSTLSKEWGIDFPDDGGKTIWARVPLEA
jgi:anti-sigma regulatory factor (Ser/Thr protein kinase)